MCKMYNFQVQALTCEILNPRLKLFNDSVFKALSRTHQGV